MTRFSPQTHLQKHSRVKIHAFVFDKNKCLRYPWLDVIYRKVGYVTKINKRTNMYFVEWFAENEHQWFAAEELFLWHPQQSFKFKKGDKVQINQYLQEAADLCADSNAHGIGEVAFVNPHSTHPYLVQFSPNGRIFEQEEADLILVEANSCGQ